MPSLAQMLTMNFNVETVTIYSSGLHFPLYALGLMSSSFLLTCGINYIYIAVQLLSSRMLYM